MTLDASANEEAVIKLVELTWLSDLTQYFWSQSQAWLKNSTRPFSVISCNFAFQVELLLIRTLFPTPSEEHETSLTEVFTSGWISILKYLHLTRLIMRGRGKIISKRDHTKHYHFISLRFSSQRSHIIFCFVLA